MPLLSLDAACCAAYLTISAKKPSPDAKCGVVFSFMRASGHGEDKTELVVRKIMSGSLLEAAGLKVGDRVMDLCNQKPRSAQEAASVLRNAKSTIEMTIERNSTIATHIADLNPLQEVIIAKLVANEALDMDLEPSKEDETLSGSYYLGGRKLEGLDVGDLIVCMGKTRRIRLNAALHPVARFPSLAQAHHRPFFSWTDALPLPDGVSAMSPDTCRDVFAKAQVGHVNILVEKKIIASRI